MGTEGGLLFSLSAANGHMQWTYRAAGAIKGSPTLSDGKLYFGDYGGHVQAVRTSNGHRVWSSSGGGSFLRAGRFYATAAVAFGRVYIGSTDGREYSFSAADGRLAWAKQTGNYVYSSAAVQNVDGVGPTVFFGSYDGTFYALDARTGGVRWTRRSGGKISGSPTIVGRTVYFSDLGQADHARPVHALRADDVQARLRRVRPGGVRRHAPVPDGRALDQRAGAQEVTFDDVARAVAGIPFMSPEQGRVVFDHVRRSGARDVLELGTAHGVGACYLAAAGAHVTTVDHAGVGVLRRRRRRSWRVPASRTG